MASIIDVEFGGQRRLSASNMTLVYYDEEFSKLDLEADFLGDFLLLTNRLKGKTVLRIVWAMEKTYKQGTIEPFNIWVKLLPDNIDFASVKLFESITSVINDVFLGGSGASKEDKK